MGQYQPSSRSHAGEHPKTSTCFVIRILFTRGYRVLTHCHTWTVSFCSESKVSAGRKGNLLWRIQSWSPKRSGWWLKGTGGRICSLQLCQWIGLEKLPVFPIRPPPKSKHLEFGPIWYLGIPLKMAPNLPSQDITRIDHVLDFWFPDVTTAPAFVRWKFILHFDTWRSCGWLKLWGCQPLGVTISRIGELRWSNCTNDYQLSNVHHYYYRWNNCTQLIINCPMVDFVRMSL